jgi:catechol 2,3-dioxygenase-like lactoylglutathione lyase family enzyme
MKMARLRHFALVVRDLEKSAKFYENVFDLKRVGQEKLDFAAAVYLSDGTINLALLGIRKTLVENIHGCPPQSTKRFVRLKRSPSMN